MNSEDMCEVTCIDEHKVAAVKAQLLPDYLLSNLSETFRVLGDGTRVKIIHALSLEELCVCDIAHLLNTTKSAISHQLRLLRTMKIVRYRKAGKLVYYSLDDAHVMNLFTEAANHIQEHSGTGAPK